MAAAWWWPPSYWVEDTRPRRIVELDARAQRTYEEQQFHASGGAGEQAEVRAGSRNRGPSG